jgi:single-stranded DNA-binding protein
MAINTVVLQGHFPASDKFLYKYYEGTNDKKSFFVGTFSVKQNYTPKGQEYPPEDLFEVRAFGNTADFISRNCPHGTALIIQGHLVTTEKKETEDGKVIWPKTVINIDSVCFQQKNAGERTERAAAPSHSPSASPAKPKTSGPSFLNRLGGNKPAHGLSMSSLRPNI